MCLKMRTMKSTENYLDKIERLKSELTDISQMVSQAGLWRQVR